MGLSDKTRKVLWARSGNRCAFCRQKLVVDATELDTESVIGEECHICAKSPDGPRYDTALSESDINNIDNLILLCSSHHKLVDDQVETYTKSILVNLKSNHEKWVEVKLKEEEIIRPVKLRRFKQNIPKQLKLMTSGKELIALASHCAGAYHGYADDLDATEVDLVGGFLQNIRDYMDIWDDIEPLGQVRATVEITENLKELAENGFFVFAANERQQLEGGISGPSAWNVLHLTIARAADPSIHYGEDGKMPEENKKGASDISG